MNIEARGLISYFSLLAEEVEESLRGGGAPHLDPLWYEDVSVLVAVLLGVMDCEAGQQQVLVGAQPLHLHHLTQGYQWEKQTQTLDLSSFLTIAKTLPGPSCRNRPHFLAESS